MKMNRTVFSGFVLLCLLLVVSCGKPEQDQTSEVPGSNSANKTEAYDKNDTLSEKADHDSMNMDDLIRYTAEYAQYTLEDTSFLGILENKRDKPIGYSHAKLEKKEEGEWYIVPYLSYVAETAELPVLSAHGAAACGTDIRLYDYTLTPGKYRMAVYYSDLEEYVNRKGKFDHIAYAEFEVIDGQNPEKTVFSELKEQSLDGVQAVSDGCAVVEAGNVSNEAAVDAFINKALLGMSCELRIVYPEGNMARHITVKGEGYSGAAFLLETVIHGKDEVVYDKNIFSYLAAIDGQLVLTNCADPENAAGLGFDQSQNVSVLPLGEENQQKLQEAAKQRYSVNSAIMKLILDEACSRDVEIYSRIGGKDDSSAVSYTIGVESADTGGEVLSDCYPEELRPVSLSRISDSAAAIHFVDEEGKAVTMALDVYAKPRRLEPTDDASKECTYTVYAYDAGSFSAVPDVMINFCTDTACTPVFTDEMGRAVFTGPAERYHVQIIMAADGWQADGETEWYAEPCTQTVWIPFTKAE